MPWCVIGELCRSRDSYTAGQPLCEACFQLADRSAGLLLYDYVDLAQHIIPTGAGGEPISGTREAPVPIDLHVEALQRAIWLFATTWEQILRDRERLPDAPTRVRDGWAVQQALKIVRPRVMLLAGLAPVTVFPDGPDGPPADQTGAEAVMAMVRLHGRVRATLGLTKLTHELPGPCADCGMPALRRDNGDDTVYCADCGAWWSGDEFRLYVELLTAQAGRISRRGRRR